MLGPKTYKFKKTYKPLITGTSHSYLAYGNFGIQALEPGTISTSQIESVRRVLTKSSKKQGDIWIRVFPHFTVTKKPLQSRMGGGKGNVEGWIGKVETNQIIFEFSAPISLAVAKLAVKIASSKLPFKIKFLKKEQNDTKTNSS